MLLNLSSNTFFNLACTPLLMNIASRIAHSKFFVMITMTPYNIENKWLPETADVTDPYLSRLFLCTI